MQNTLDHVKLLHEAIKRDDHNEVYEYSKMLLKEYPEDIEYLQCFIISSLRISLADDLASNIFKTMPVNELLLPLYAYYLYIQGEHEKSIKCISDLPSPLAFRLLLAQNYFKIQQYDRSAALMNSLLKELKHSKESRETYSVNLLATGVNSVLTPAVIRDYDQSYLAKGACGELFYNYALLAFEIGDYERSLTYLDRFAKTL